jgi:hypothetical protein
MSLCVPVVLLAAPACCCRAEDRCPIKANDERHGAEPSAAVRLWRDVTGNHQVRAVFEEAQYSDKQKDTMITLRKEDGEAITVAAKRLCEEDRRYVARTVRTRRERPPAPAAEEKPVALSEAERQALLKRTGVSLWPELTKDEQEAAVQQQKEFLAKVDKEYTAGRMYLHEKEYFLYFTDARGKQVSQHTVALDNMYRILCQAFGIPPKTNIWRGKAVVVAFQCKASFAGFEQRFFKKTVDNCQGRAHLFANGDVIIGCYYGNDPAFFRSLLVHEAVHGFMHRFKSRENVPSWLDEGAADFIAGKVVPGCDDVKLDQTEAIQRLWRTRCVDGDFFTARQIKGWQYGLASSLTGYLLEWDPHRYRKLIELIKTGVEWEESLKRTYGVSPEQLIEKYGDEHLKIRHLKLPAGWRDAGRVPTAEPPAARSSGRAPAGNPETESQS